MLAKFGSFLTFILAVVLVVLLTVTVYFQHERTRTDDFRIILPDNDRNIPSHPSKADYYNYGLNDHSREAQHQQNAVNSERNYELAIIPFTQSDNSSESSAQALDMEPVLIEPRKEPRIGRAKLDLHRALSNGVDFDMWTGMAIIGGQRFRLLFDTTSSGLWIPSMDSDVRGKEKFDFKAAQLVEELPCHTDIPRHRLIPQDGNPNEVKLYKGQVKIGGKSALHTIFWTVRNFKPGFEGLPFDGVLGLGFRKLDKDYPGTSFLDRICVRYYAECIFSFYLADLASQLHLLRTDPKCFKEDTVEYHTVLPYLETQNFLSYWVIGGGTIKTNGVPTVTVMQTIFDTTTGPIFGPPQLVNEFYKKLHEFGLDVETRKRGGRNLYFFNCGPRAAEFKISFSWGKRDWEWAANQLVLFKTDDGKCAGAIQPRPQSMGVKEGAWVVGTSFLRMVYATFHRHAPGSSWVAFAEVTQCPPQKRQTQGSNQGKNKHPRLT
ncbi:aspartic peptidase domain-containing protein [Amanita rubescens]|nr:aspartic peptidase domain-containing protein [Amanita rubescens]